MSGGKNKKRRILIVDDHPIVRNGLVEMINHEEDIEVVGEANDAEAALCMLDEANPDLVIADISLASTNGIELTKAIADRRSSLPVLILSMHDEALYAERALRAGARGYVTKGEPPDILLGAIREVLAGDMYVSHRISNRLLRGMLRTPPIKTRHTVPSERVNTLTDRELEIFASIGQGTSPREIAARIGRSVKTVEAHRSNIIAKLGFLRAADMQHYATQWMQLQAESKGNPSTLAPAPAKPPPSQT